MAPYRYFIPPESLAKGAKRETPRSTATPFQPARLGVGEYYHPSLFNKATIYAQLEFLNKVEDLAQNVLVDLALSVRPLYESVRHTIDENDLRTMRSDQLRQLARSRREGFELLANGIDQWLASFNLDSDWVRDTALRTLYHWTGEKIAVPGRTLLFTRDSYSSAAPLKAEEMLFEFSDYGWEMTDATKSAFVKRITSKFKLRIEQYIHFAEKRALEAGWKRTPELRRSGKNSNTLRHIEWFVRWQVQQWKASEIAVKYGLGNARKSKSGRTATSRSNVSERASAPLVAADEKRRRIKAAYRSVHDALEKAAELLELPLRAGSSREVRDSSQ